MTTVRLLSEEPQSQRRIPLLELSVALVEDVGLRGASEQVAPEAYSPEFQLVFPYRGMFVWEVGHDQVVGDPNQALFVTGGEAFRMRHPFPGGYGELIVTPSEPVLEELAGGRPHGARAHPLFRRRSRRIDPALQLHRARFQAWANGPLAVDEPLAAEEHVLDLLRAMLDGDSEPVRPARRSQQLLERTKTYLASRLDRSMGLGEIARAVGASPGYLTQLFHAVEGIPLHRYLTQLRLARALVELPHAENLTELALELGFSSHSHFTARFHRAFGLTPSEFRRGVSRPLPRSPVRMVPRPRAASGGIRSPTESAP